MTPDLVHAIQEHNRIMSLWWKVPRYIVERKAFVKRNPVCKRCRRPTTTPGHSHDDYQYGFEHYLQKVIKDECEPLCNSCNFHERKGKKPCPECVKEGNGNIRYISQFETVCFNHLPKTERDRIITTNRIKKLFDKHPCQSHSKPQGCMSPDNFSSVCDRSKKRAEGCDHFKGRVQAQ